MERASKDAHELTRRLTVVAGAWNGADDDPRLLELHLLDRLHRDQDELAAEAASADLEQIGLVDAREEAEPLDEADGTVRRDDLEPLATRK